MTLKLVVDAIDDVPEAARPLYAEKDGKFHLQVEGIPDVGGLKSALEAERRKAAEAEKRLKGLKDVDPDEYAKLIEEKAERERKDAEQRGEYEKVLRQKDERHTAALKVKEEDLARMRGALEARLVDSEATRAIAAAKGIPELLMPHVKARVKVVEVSGEYQVRVLNKAGAESLNPKGEPMSIADLVEEMRADAVFARAFEATGTRGSGAGAGSGGGGPSAGGKFTPEQAEKLSLAEYRKARAEGKIG